MSNTIARNKKAYSDFQVLEEYECGIVLTGGEVKSIKGGNISLKESFVKNLGSDLYLINSNIVKWPQDSTSDYDPARTRKLLLNKQEVEKINLKLSREGLTLIPLSVYLKGALIKVKIGLAKGLKKYEKKQKLIEKDKEREQHRDTSKI